MDAADHLLRDMEHRIEEQLHQAERMRAELSETSVTVESPGGETTVTVDSAGSLVGLQLTEQAMRLKHDELAKVILTATRSAQTKLAARMQEVVEGVYGGDSESAAFISSVYAAQFPGAASESDADGPRR